LDKELFVNFYTKQLELLKSGVLPPVEVQASFIDGDPQADQVSAGKVMSKNVTVNTAQTLESLMPGQMEVLNNPAGPSGGGWAQSTVFFSVSANSQHKVQAKDFIRWFISDPEAGKALGLTRGIPINDAIFAEIEPNLEAKDIMGKKLVDVAKPYALPFYGAAAGYTELLDLFVNETMSLMYGQRTVEEAYNNNNDLGQKIAATIQ
jgi:multiple sugar transport system substrate-binding protein